MLSGWEERRVLLRWEERRVLLGGRSRRVLLGGRERRVLLGGRRGGDVVGWEEQAGVVGWEERRVLLGGRRGGYFWVRGAVGVVGCDLRCALRSGKQRVLMLVMLTAKRGLFEDLFLTPMAQALHQPPTPFRYFSIW